MKFLGLAWNTKGVGDFIGEMGSMVIGFSCWMVRDMECLVVVDLELP